MQAYAELEDDTPGQIFGVTHKTDGKSSSFSASSSDSSTRSSSSSSSESSSKFKTQGPEKEEYVAHDISGRSDYKRPNNSRKWMWIGSGIGMLFALYLLNQKNDEYEMQIVQERLAKKEAEEFLRVQKEQQRENEKFHDA